MGSSTTNYHGLVPGKLEYPPFFWGGWGGWFSGKPVKSCPTNHPTIHAEVRNLVGTTVNGAVEVFLGAGGGRCRMVVF